jgi:hypothetical protein
MNVASGGTLNVQSGGALQQAGVPITLASSAVEVVTATNVITAAESGTTFFLNSATEFASTLPVAAAGLRYTFIVAAAPVGADYTIGTNAGDNILNIVAMAGGTADAADVATAQDVINLVDAQAVVGDWVYCISDGTSWQCTKTDTEIEWNGKVKTLKAGVEYNLPADLAKKVKPAPVRKKKT